MTDHMVLWLDGGDRALLAAQLLEIDGVRALGGIRPDGDDTTTLRALVVPASAQDAARRMLDEWTGSATGHWSGPARPGTGADPGGQPGNHLADHP